MAKKSPNNPPQPWLLKTVSIWLVFLTLSPFLVTVTHTSAISLVRELLLLTIVIAAVKQRRATAQSLVSDDLEQLAAWLVALAAISTIFITHSLGAAVWSTRYSLEPLMIFWSLRSFSFDTSLTLQLIRRWIGWALALVVIGILFVTVVPRDTLLAWGYSPTVAVGNGQWVGGATLPAYQTVAGSIPRLQSTLTGPIQFAGFALLLVFLLPVLPLAVKRHWYYAALLVAVIGVLGSFSRAAWIALIVISITLGLRRLRQNGWKKIELAALGIIVGVVSLAVVGNWLTRPDAEGPREFVANVLTREGSDREHVSSITDSWRNLSAVWLTGYGFGRSGAASIQYAATSSNQPAPRFVDNSYLRWGEELGIVGAAVFIALIWMLIAELNRTGNTAGRGLALAGVALAITALFTDMWLEAVPVLTFFAFAGLLCRPNGYSEQPESVTFDSFNLSRRSLSATTSLLGLWARQVTPRHVVTINPEMLVAAWNSPEFASTLKQADLITADGAGIVAAVAVNRKPLMKPRWLRPLQLTLRWLGSFVLLLFAPRQLDPQVARVTGSDLTLTLLDDANTQHRRVALLGSTDLVINHARENIAKRWPNIHLVFAEPGPQTVADNGALSDKDARALIGKIAHAKPAYLFVAFGVPKQERFIARYKKELGVPVMIGVSGAFDTVLAHQIRRAPNLLQRLHIEWLWRLVRQPSRLNRIITAVWRFPIAYSKRLLKS